MGPRQSHAMTWSRRGQGCCLGAGITLWRGGGMVGCKDRARTIPWRGLGTVKGVQEMGKSCLRRGGGVVVRDVMGPLCFWQNRVPLPMYFSRSFLSKLKLPATQFT
ncbi:hypothetical protein PIB30_069432 [Stylosanthes scabra]|uniref:Uncharacterized protein n=1 Tax=Stylosanthes scabra TaxID=79078 RepID=A0ABU6UQN4_9FABA|nr:hypothetical protein [Stylosanthes scabra]